MTSNGSALTVDPAVGLPSGHPVLGSVTDGVSLPYSLDLGGRAAARLVLTFDGTSVAEVAGGAARGTITVPAKHPALRRDDDVDVLLTAYDTTGATITSAQTVGSIADGAVLAATLRAYNPSPADLEPGDTLWVTEGETARFQTQVQSGAVHVPITRFDLTIDGTSILHDSPPTGGSSQWLDGAWTAPSGESSHQLIYSAGVGGDSSLQSQTYTVAVQPTGSFAMDVKPMSVESGTDLTITGVLKRSTDFVVVAGATVELWWRSGTDADYSLQASVATDAGGHYSLVFTPDDSGAFEVRTSGVPGLVGTTWSVPVAVSVLADVLLAVDNAATTTGSALTFTVRAPAAMAGVHGMLQLWNGQCWNTVAFAPLDAHGRATLSYVPSIAGNHRFGALTGYGSSFAPTASADLTVTVR